MSVPHLERACELLWQAGHPRLAEALEQEVNELAARAQRFEAVLYPSPFLVDSGGKYWCARCTPWPDVTYLNGGEVSCPRCGSAAFLAGDAPPYPMLSLNRAQRRALKHGDGISAELDPGPRQGG